MKKTYILIAMTSILAFSCAPKVPYTREDGTVDTYFGHEVKDPYRWLEDDSSKETAAWVEAQNKVSSHYLNSIPFRGKVLERLKEVSNYEKCGIPVRHSDGKWYFFRNDGLQNQSVLYRKDSLDGEEFLVLDPNVLSEDGTVALKGTYMNSDCSLMAYSISRSGSDWQEFYVMDMKSGKLLEDHIQWAKFSGAAWHGNGFYYSAYGIPEEGHEFSVKNEGHKIFYHEIGTPQSSDRLFFENPSEPLRFYTLSTNEEQTLAFLFEDGADNGNNLYVMDLRRPGSKFIQMTSGMKYNCYPVETIGEDIYILTNLDAPMNRLVKASLKAPAQSAWKDVIPQGKSVLEGVSFVRNGSSISIIANYMEDAATHAYLYSIDGSGKREIPLPGVGTASFSSRKESGECFYSFTSYTVPGAIYSLSTETLESELYFNPKIAADLSVYQTDQVFYPSKDGTLIPMFITHKKGIELDGSSPALLYGYGGFDISLTPGFSSMRIPYLEKGGIYAVACLRGGGEYGMQWHLAGTKLHKQNVFDDFIAAAEWLIEKGYTSSSRLAIQGGSNGGLLVGACMTQRPELYAAAVPQVGVMDMLRYHKFTIGWNWAPDYGTSEDSEEMYLALRAYSPLHNLREGEKYPATLVTTADHDDRVVPAHSFKFAATLQKCNASGKPAIIRIDTKAGHGGGKPLAKVLEEQADIYSFIMLNTGMKY